MSRLKKIMAALLCVLLLQPGTGLAGTQLWDGYSDDTAEESIVQEDGSIVVFNPEDTGYVYELGFVPKVIEGSLASSTLGWIDHTTKANVQLYNLPVTDWTDTPVVNFRLYSETKTNAKLQFCVNAVLPEGVSYTMSYNREVITVNWTGWKDFSYNVNEMTYTTNAPDFTKVSHLTFASSGWSSTPNADSKLYLDKIWISPAAESGDAGGGSFVDSYTVDDSTAVEELMASSGGSAMYIYCDKVYQQGARHAINADDRMERVVRTGSTIMAPVSFFDKFMGTTTAESSGGYTITKGDKSISITLDSTAFTANGSAGEYTQPPRSIDGYVQLPVVETLAALGITASQFLDDKLLLVADYATLEAIGSNDKYLYALSYLIFGKYDISNATHEDFVAAKDKARLMLCGDETTNDMTDEDIAARVKSITNTGRNTWNSMNKESDAVVLWGTSAVTMTSEMSRQAKQIEYMAKAWGTYGGELYHDSALLADIKYGLAWMYENLYGEDELNGVGWHSTSGYNWYDWLVDTPLALVETMLIIEDELTPELITQYMSLYTYLLPIMRPSLNVESSQNRIIVGTLNALIQEDKELLTLRQEDYNRLVGLLNSLTDSGEHTDFSHWQHAQTYNIGYGLTWMERAPYVASIVAGTPLEFSTPRHYNIISIVENGYRTVMYKGQAMTSFNGRWWGQQETITGGNFIVRALPFIGLFGEEEDHLLKTLLKENLANEATLKRAKNNCPLYLVKTLNELIADESIPENPEYNNAHSFYTGDKATVHRTDYAFCLSMSSEKVPLYESINGCNHYGWYSNDGVLYLYTGKDPEAFSTTNFNGVDSIVYGVPGTTEDVQTREAVSIRGAEVYYTPRDFVGSMDFKDEYLLATMDFEALHHEADNPALEYEGTVDSYGGDQPNHENDLVAKKSWFIFDDEAVCLGAGITSTTGYEVNTYVENRRLLYDDEEGKYQVEEEGEKLTECTVVSATATLDDGNVAANVLDNDLTTRWSAEGASGCDLTLELDKVYDIAYVGISVYNGQGKYAIFDLEVSTDGVNWTQAWSGQSDGATAAMQPYVFSEVHQAKYVKLVGHGRNINLWNSFCEMKVYPPREDGQILVHFGDDYVDNTVRGIDDVYVNGKLAAKRDWTKSYKGTKLKSFSIDGVAGYYFPYGGKVTLEKKKQTARDNSDKGVMKAYFAHGKNPLNATYAYTILPLADNAQTQSYVSKPDTRIIENSTKLQAVREDTLGMTGMVFHSAGSLNEITVSDPCMVTVQEKDGIYDIGVVEPTSKLQSITVTINKPLELASADNEITVVNDGSKAVLTINVTETYGKTVNATFTVPGQSGLAPVLSVDSVAETITASNVESKTMLVASYRGNQLLEVKQVEVDSDVTVPFAGTRLDLSQANGVRAFLWESMDSQKAVCAPAYAAITPTSVTG